MGGKIDIYNLGENGVDTSKSPLHQSDGDLIQAQNATPDPAGLLGGIRKRDGMSKLNSGALTGSIGGAVNVPLPAPGTRTYYAGEATLSATPPDNPWQSSIGGSSGWAGRADPSEPQPGLYISAPANMGAMTGTLTYRRRLYYPGAISVGNESPVIRVWDGVNDNELCRIPNEPGSVSEAESIGHMWIHRGFLYVAAGTGFEFEVFQVNIVTGAIVRIGNAFPDHTLFGLSFLDRVWVGQLGDAGAGLIRWIRNGEESWTLERTAGAGHQGYAHGANYKGDLFVGTYTDAGTAALVERYSPGSAAWATSETGPDTSVNYFTCFAVFNDELFCIYRSSTSLLVKKWDGSSWSTDLDILGAGHADAHPCGILAENDALYVAFGSLATADPDGYILRRTAAGAWSKPATLEHGNGSIAFLP